jgi:hypothetical protein
MGGWRESRLLQSAARWFQSIEPPPTHPPTPQTQVEPVIQKTLFDKRQFGVHMSIHDITAKQRRIERQVRRPALTGADRR